MFGKRKKPAFIEVTKLSSLVAEGVEITGDVVFASGIRIDGKVKGNVIGRPLDGQAPPLLVLSDKGQIEGSVRCGDAVINGTVTGDLEVAHFLELQASARVCGTIRYEQLQMDVGASVQGQLVRSGAEAAVVTAALPAPAGGNVVELSVDNSANNNSSGNNSGSKAAAG
jgi:cytoskeletal protein CcmA (bactofilin family)